MAPGANHTVFGDGSSCLFRLSASVACSILFSAWPIRIEGCPLRTRGGDRQSRSILERTSKKEKRKEAFPWLTAVPLRRAELPRRRLPDLRPSCPQGLCRPPVMRMRRRGAPPSGREGSVAQNRASIARIAFLPTRTFPAPVITRRCARCCPLWRVRLDLGPLLLYLPEAGSRNEGARTCNVIITS